MFTLDTSPLELIGRVALVYVFLFALLRLFGKRHVGELAPFDLLVLLILSECVQNALIAREESVLGGWIAALTLMALSQVFGYAISRSKKLERLLEGKAKLLVRNGHVCDDALEREQISRSELLEALRREGCTSLTSVRFAVLENDGAITIGLRSERADRPAR